MVLGIRVTFWSHLGVFPQWGFGFTTGSPTLRRSRWGRGWWLQDG